VVAAITGSRLSTAPARAAAEESGIFSAWKASAASSGTPRMRSPQAAFPEMRKHATPVENAPAASSSVAPSSSGSAAWRMRRTAWFN
jgi:hypothetical protein